MAREVDPKQTRKALRIIRKLAAKSAAPEMLVATDLCFCEYTDHGHCGPLVEVAGKRDVDNDATLKLLETMPINRELLGRNRRSELDVLMRGIRKKGYAVYDHPDKITQLAVPIFRNGKVCAGLSIKFFRSSMDQEVAAARFTEPLRQAARKISCLTAE